MAALTRLVHAWDGLKLHVQEWGGQHRNAAVPLLCLPGLVRTADDFAAVAERHAGRRRIVSLDYPGRGRSGRARAIARYRPEACLRDVIDVCAALHLHRVIAVGTSFGGLLTMGLAATRPAMLAGAVLNDIGPELGAAGGAFLRRFIAADPALPDRNAAAAHLRQLLPHLSLRTDAQWLRFAELTYTPGTDGRWHPRWDTRIATLLKPPIRDLWPLFGALPRIPLLLVRGTLSNILLEGTVAQMQARRPDMLVAEIEGVGHAPTLAEPQAEHAIDALLEEAA
ncbi:alpha/beta fold hydrolase [Limobrevibacterium gyesilva]|uniref:Alpha/beta hydrolase n=1 Tax=Limobrevibacterium gyesilva TaxID=2991712 RepID=A0AA41YU52_9PROT|nr:alpha/beta hydrolase [Limobrevibacterium gyesilva]MCW3475467.1 alpha/beta hydrolase [Limobrevibacterium gyesilva]